MRKILAIILCTICLSFPVTVQAQENVTNQLDAILVQLENLDQVLDFIVDNQDYLQWWLDTGIFNEYLRPLFDKLQWIVEDVDEAKTLLISGIAPDIASIKDDVAALSVDVAVYVSQIVSSINGVTSEVAALQSWLLDFMLTQNQLDNSLNYALSNFDHFNDYAFILGQITDSIQSLDGLNNYSSTLAEILQSIQSMDYSDQVEAALYNISQALNNLGHINVVIDLGEEIENLDINFDLDLGTALSRLEGDLSSVLNSTEHISYLFEVYINLFSLLKENQQLTNDQLRAFLTWYKDSFFPGLRNVLTAQSVWLERQGIREDAEGKFRDDLEQFLTYDAEMPTDSDVPYVAQLEEAGLEEPEVPDEKIYSAVDSVETDLEDVEHELTGALDIVDESFKGLLNSINLRWGSFNPVLSFSFNSPLKGSNSTIVFRYDFSKCELLPPCKAASTGVWGIILFVESFLAITATFGHLIEN